MESSSGSISLGEAAASAAPLPCDVPSQSPPPFGVSAPSRAAGVSLPTSSATPVSPVLHTSSLSSSHSYKSLSRSAEPAAKSSVSASKLHPLSREVARILSHPFLEAPFLPEALACLSSCIDAGDQTAVSADSKTCGDSALSADSSLTPSQSSGLERPSLLGPLIYREKLRIHQEALGAFAPIRRQIAEVAEQAQTLSRMCSQSSSQLRRSRTQLAGLLRKVEGLREQQRALQSRQRLCQLLLDALQLPARLLEALTGRRRACVDLPETAHGDKTALAGAAKGPKQGLGPEGPGEGDSKEDLQLDSRFFEALKEVEKIRKRALKLQAQTSMADRDISEEHQSCMQNASLANRSDRMLFGGAPPRLADDVLQHTADLREAAFERLYLWMQRIFKSACVGGVNAKSRQDRRSDRSDHSGGQSSRHERETPSGDSETLDAVQQVEAFAAALATAGLARKWEREGLARAGETQSLTTVLCVNDEPSLLFRGFQALEDRHAYLQHSVQEFSRVRSQLIIDAFWGSSLESEAAPPARASTGPVSGLLARTRDLAQHWRKGGVFGGNAGLGGGSPGDADGRAAAEAANGLALGASFDTVCRAEPVEFLRATLQYVVHAVAAERAVIRGLLGLLPREDTQPPGGASGGIGALGSLGLETPGGRSKCLAEETDSLGGAERRQTEPVSGLDVEDPAKEAREATVETREGARRHLDTQEWVLDENGRPGALPDGPSAEGKEGRGGDLGAPDRACGGVEPSGSCGEMLGVREALRGTRLLQETTAGMSRPLRATIEQAFSMIRASATAPGAAGGTRLQQQHVLGVLLMVRMLDAYAALLRCLLVFDMGLASATRHPQEPKGGPGPQPVPGEGPPENVREPSVSDPTYPSPAARGRLETRTGNAVVETSFTVPELVLCCEEYAEKGEELFLSLWERQVVRAASSSTAAQLSSVLLSGRLSPGVPGAEGSAGLGGEGELIATEGGAFLELTGRLREALEILHAPVISVEEENELWLLASGAAAAASRRSRPMAAGGLPAWADTPVVTNLVRDRDASVWGTEVRRRRHLAGRRSRITGMRAFEDLSSEACEGGEGEQASEELHAWVEASVAPLLNFCRQEAQRFSDAGETAVCLINAYASVQEPLRRFRVCRSYLRVLAELLDQQMVKLIEVESGKILAYLGLADRLEAVRRAVEREKRRLGVAGPDALPQVGDGKAPLQVGTEQSGDAGPDDEVLLHKEGLVKFFGEFYVALYGLSALNLDYVDRLMHWHLRSHAKKAVLNAVLQAYSEIYNHVSHLRVATHTPGDVALLLDV
ncbi:oligomeric complex protein COG6 [Toxoplasma gondii RUB]|uniref:Conserved oligomeric Golgi complex subunit 6 n=1 Tax=Toxoplasma gondii RUB TaxID=935652 RepID=A0A086LND4_TOXGO|nr:oligomeric complex protein COG6 [Toxoplasma gondii RUB]